MNRADGPEDVAGPDIPADPAAEQAGAPDKPAGRSRRLKLTLRVLGAAVALLALGLCVRALVKSWPTVERGLQHANVALLVLALILSALGSCGLAFLWQRTLVVFDRPYPYLQAASWFFAGELGKYLPGRCGPSSAGVSSPTAPVCAGPPHTPAR